MTPPLLELPIPGLGKLSLAHLVLDYNGTLALDGTPLPGVEERLAELAGLLDIRVLTADTHGTVRQKLASWPCAVEVLSCQALGECPGWLEDEAKVRVVRRLGAERVAFMGNGRNDALALAEAALGVCVLQAEGASTAALGSANLVVTNILDGLDLLLKPARLAATLRR